MAKAKGVSAFSHPATDRSFLKLNYAEKIEIYGGHSAVDIQLYFRHGTSKFNEPRYSEISVEIAPKAFPHLLQMMCRTNLKVALEAMSAELTLQLRKLPIAQSE